MDRSSRDQSNNGENQLTDAFRPDESLQDFSPEQLDIELLLEPSTRQGKEREMLPPFDIPTGSTIFPPSGIASGIAAPILTSGSSTMNNQFRSRPKIDVDPPGPPTQPKFIILAHPGNGLFLFSLYAYDRMPGPEPKFGVHHETAVQACQIVANNKPGYLSKSRDRDAEQVDVAVLPPDTYYYHLTEFTEKLYPICRTFRSWTFPHTQFPESWLVPSTQTPLSGTGPVSWTVLSQRIKDRDNVCRVSGSREWLTTAHIIPRDEEVWMQANDMQTALEQVPCHSSPYNLFLLRCDFHYGGYDRAQFVVVPKCGQFVVHFLDASKEFANGYHNTIFDHSELSPRALYARFAWAIFKRVAEAELSPKEFKFLDTQNPDPDEKQDEDSERDPRENWKRKREDEDRCRGDRSQDHEKKTKTKTTNSSTTMTTNPNTAKTTNPNPTKSRLTTGVYRGRQAARHKQLETLLQGPNAWLSDVVFKITPDDSSLEADVREIEEDLSVASRVLPFFVNSEIKPNAVDYDTIPWYPGIEVVKRRKQAYLHSHPHITAHSDSLQGDRTV